MSRRSFVFLLLTLLLITTAPAFAATYGTIKVRVVDADDIALAGAIVEATSPIFIGSRTETSDGSGEVLLTGLVPGQYSVRVSLEGFQAATISTSVNANQTTEVRAPLALSAVTESIVVTTELPVVDTARITVSDHVTLEELQPLPISRDYRGIAQLVTGVNVVPNQGGADAPVDPASKAGNNYADRGTEGRFANTGSRDNYYYLDGLNITDMGNGTGSMTFNSSVILEEEVITSGVPAEFGGGRGFVGNVVTKSGGNSFSGSLSYYAQTASMWGNQDAEDTRLIIPETDQQDAGLTLGGPLVRDRAWFFVAGQSVRNATDVELSASASATGETTEYTQDRDNYFGKATWKPSDSATITGQYFSDPRETAGSLNVNTVSNRYTQIEDTPSYGSFTYQQIWNSNLLTDLRIGDFNEDYLASPHDPDAGITNTIRYPAGVSVPAHQRDRGSASTRTEQTQQKLQGDLSATYFFQAAGSHAFKAGVQVNRWEDETNSFYPFGSNLTSLATDYRDMSFGVARALGIFSTSEYLNALSALRRAPTSSSFAFTDANHDGVISDAEFAALQISSSANNQHGLNFLRISDQRVGPNNVKTDDDVLHLQDEWTTGNWRITLGLRVEDIEYTASDGSTILDLDPTYSPRVGVGYDIGGRGDSKISFFYGKYYDPLRTDMVHFAGNVSGRVRCEEVFIGTEFFCYRQRGSATVRDNVFAPNLENQTQDEYALTYGINITPTLGLTAQAYYREDKNLIEDYDPYLYWNGVPGYDEEYNVPDEFALLPQDHGFPASGLPGAANFFLGNLIGATRETKGVDIGIERRFADSWTASVQYSWKEAEGNTNSDGNADLQGDLIEIDPRQPYMTGSLPGTIENQLKIFGMYRAPFGLDIGGLFYWNDGVRYTEADFFLPGVYDILINHHLAGNNYTVTGAEKHPSWYTLDLKLGYEWKIRDDVGLNFLLQVQNVLDDQDAIFVEVAHNDPEFTTYGEDRSLLAPRRYQLGVSLRF